MGLPSSQLEGPCLSMGVHHPNSRGLQRGEEGSGPVILDNNGKLKTVAGSREEYKHTTCTRKRPKKENVAIK